MAPLGVVDDTSIRAVSTSIVPAHRISITSTTDTALEDNEKASAMLEMYSFSAPEKSSVLIESSAMISVCTKDWELSWDDARSLLPARCNVLLEVSVLEADFECAADTVVTKSTSTQMEANQNGLPGTRICGGTGCLRLTAAHPFARSNRAIGTGNVVSDDTAAARSEM